MGVPSYKMNQDFYLNYGEAKSFYCAVDMGDLVYSLLFAKYKNVDTIYLDDTKKGINNRNFNEASRKFIEPLLLSQPYIRKIEKYTNQVFDINYGEHQKADVVVGTNLTAFHASKFNLECDSKEVNESWLECPSTDTGKNIVINRSLRYRGDANFYLDFFKHINPQKCVFVGLEEEYEDFIKTFRYPVDYKASENAYELMMAINSCDVFFGNESVSCAIAKGLGKTCFVELCRQAANYIFTGNKKINYFGI